MNKTLSFQITDQAWEHLLSHVDSSYLIISLKISGCSGYAYEFEPCDQISTDEYFFIEKKGFDIQVLLPKANFDKFFKGAKLDLKKSTFGTQLYIDNPNIKDSCGCGQSFTFEGNDSNGTTQR